MTETELSTDGQVVLKLYREVRANSKAPLEQTLFSLKRTAWISPEERECAAALIAQEYNKA